MAYVLPAGKLPPALLEKLLQGLPQSADVLIGAAYGEDAAVVAGRDDECWVITTDPITFAAEQLGWYLVQVNANDIACMGATPEFLTAALLFPAGATTPEQIEECFDQVRRACGELGISWIGGHTEITPAVSQPVACGQMIGRVARSRLVTSGGARTGDDIVLIGLLGVEGTAILAREKRADLAAHFPSEFLDRAARFLFDPGIGITRAARVACDAAHLTALHDPTEGGLSSALREIGAASGLGALLYDRELPAAPETRGLCAFFGIDVLGLISSGSLLAACDPSETPRLLEALPGVASCIGQMRPAAEGFRIGSWPLPAFDRDELARVLRA
ncbi:MAG: hydrogenase expression protein [Acidobacteria bacterium]|nr:hydrogenase expression protein [Acidobacteriota bacterium]